MYLLFVSTMLSFKKMLFLHYVFFLLPKFCNCLVYTGCVICQCDTTMFDYKFIKESVKETE